MMAINNKLGQNGVSRGSGGTWVTGVTPEEKNLCVQIYKE